MGRALVERESAACEIRVSEIRVSEIRVKVADHALAAAGQQLVTIGLGSCVAIAIHAPRARLGALAHVLLPDVSIARDHGNPARFADLAVPMLVAALRRRGATEPLTAKLAGGAGMFAQLLRQGGINMGARNAEAARAALKLAGVTLLAEDTGGDYGRSVWFDPATGTVTVRSLRGGDRVL